MTKEIQAYCILCNEVEWKKSLALFLTKKGLMNPGDTGKLIINLNQGGVTSVEKTMTLK